MSCKDANVDGCVVTPKETAEAQYESDLREQVNSLIKERDMLNANLTEKIAVIAAMEEAIAKEGGKELLIKVIAATSKVYTD